MTSTYNVLIGQAVVENSATQKYLSPADGKGTVVTEFTMTNYSAGAVSVNVWIASGAAGDTTNIVRNRSLAAAETYNFPQLIGRYLTPGEKIYWAASAATSVNGHASGRELT